MLDCSSSDRRTVDLAQAGWALFVVFALVASPIHAQDVPTVRAQLSVHAGTYAMDDLEAWQEAEVEAFERLLRLTPAIVDAFPANWGLRGTVTYRRWSRLQLGLRGGFGSTGGRVSYADYSGSYTFDQKVHRWYAGPTAEYQLVHLSRWDLTVWSGGYLYGAHSVLSVETEIQLDGLPEQQVNESTSGRATLEELRRSTTFHAYSFGAVPEIAVTWHGLPLFVRVHVGYDFSFENELEREGDAVSLSGFDDPRLDWEGLRFGLGMGIAF